MVFCCVGALVRWWIFRDRGGPVLMGEKIFLWQTSIIHGEDCRLSVCCPNASQQTKDLWFPLNFSLAEYSDVAGRHARPGFEQKTSPRSPFGPLGSSRPNIGGHRNWFGKKAMLPFGSHQAPLYRGLPQNRLKGNGQRIFVELMTSDCKLKAPREGSK